MSNGVLKKQDVLERSIYSPFFCERFPRPLGASANCPPTGACNCDLAPGTTYPESLPNAFYICTDNKGGGEPRRGHFPPQRSVFPFVAAVSWHMENVYGFARL